MQVGGKKRQNRQEIAARSLREAGRQETGVIRMAKGKSKNKFNQSWLHDHINDPYVKMAQRDGYRARAAYKLKEIDEQDKLIQPGQVIVDLGAAPGSWSQYARNKLAASPRAIGGKPDGAVVAIDILPMEPVADVTFIQGDFREEEVFRQLEEVVLAASGGAKIDLVLSDMAPNLSGVAFADAARIEYLCDLALDFAQAHLKADGALLVKCFHGSGYSQIVEKFKRQFKVVAPRKPKASRDKSSETFILGRYLKVMN
jgi:23S rRNA (uridine2552-2'-O)-methyltransferase